MASSAAYAAFIVSFLFLFAQQLTVRGLVRCGAEWAHKYFFFIIITILAVKMDSFPKAGIALMVMEKNLNL